MKALIYRELEVASITKKLYQYVFFMSICLLVAAWIIGPNLLNLISVEQMSILITIIIFITINTTISNNIEVDSESSQKVFLQTLPIKTEHLVHAKFLTVLLLNILAFIWAISLTTVHILINNGEWSYLMITYIMSSMILFISSIIVLNYFVCQHQRPTLVFYVSLVIWAVVFGSGIYLFSTLGLSMELSMGIALLGALIVYIASWFTVIIRIKTKGIHSL